MPHEKARAHQKDSPQHPAQQHENNKFGEINDISRYF